jgi:hypothetical protein
MAARYDKPVRLEPRTAGIDTGDHIAEAGGERMKWIRSAAVVAAATAGGVAARRLLANRTSLMPGRKQDPEWLVATVYRSPSDIAPDGRLPEPLARLGDAVEVRIRPAPGDRGTELSVRPRLAEHGTRAATRDAWRTARLALREAKQLCETGEVLQPDAPPTTRKTLLNRPLQYATSHAREEGRL